MAVYVDTTNMSSSAPFLQVSQDDEHVLRVTVYERARHEILHGHDRRDEENSIACYILQVTLIMGDEQVLREITPLRRGARYQRRRPGKHIHKKNHKEKGKSHVPTAASFGGARAPDRREDAAAAAAASTPVQARRCTGGDGRTAASSQASSLHERLIEDILCCMAHAYNGTYNSFLNDSSFILN